MPETANATHDPAVWWQGFVLVIFIGLVLTIKARSRSQAAKCLSTFGIFFIGAIDFARVLILSAGGLRVVYLATDLLFKALYSNSDAKVNVGIPFKIITIIVVHSGLVEVLDRAKRSYFANELSHLESEILQNGLVRSIEGPVQERERSPTLEVEPAAPGNSPNVRRLGRLRNGGRA